MRVAASGHRTTFRVTGDELRTRDGNVGVAEPAAAGWMFVTLNDSGRSPCCGLLQLCGRRCVPGAPDAAPSTRPPLFANDNVGIGEAVEAGQPGGGRDVRGGCPTGSGALKTTGCIWYTTAASHDRSHTGCSADCSRGGQDLGGGSISPSSWLCSSVRLPVDCAFGSTTGARRASLCRSCESISPRPWRHAGSSAADRSSSFHVVQAGGTELAFAVHHAPAGRDIGEHRPRRLCW